MSRYGQYCPLALAAETLCERWNMLILRRLMDGSTRFSKIHQGVPKISATLLARRLDDLEKAGLLEKKPIEGKRGHDYFLTQAGQELKPLIDGISVWGQKWARDMTTDDLDPEFLLYSMHQRLNSPIMPKGRIVLAFAFSGAPKHCRRFWLVHTDGAVDMCLKDPGYDVDLSINTDLLLFIECWRGIRDLRQEIRSGKITVEGSKEHRNQFPDWLLLSGFAEVERVRQGGEKTLQSFAEKGR